MARDPRASAAPTFAVVGHPNKGKSSIVATLARDDSVAISPEPGTTLHARRYPMRVDDEVLYVLVDTPGFQRARRALGWMRERETTAAKRHEVVARFVEEHRGTGLFTDEVELLTPVIAGAGVLYVVDGSVPYGPDYEPEMEVLRWTGAPSMALINPMGPADHVAEWRDALSQYFRIVRVFNAVTAEFEKRLELLRAFGQMREDWRAPLERAVAVLEADRAQRRRRAAERIAAMLVAMLTLRVSRRVAPDEDPSRYRAELDAEYRERLRELERSARDDVQALYEHFALERREGEMPAELVAEDLFSERAWEVLGLSRRDFLTMGAAGGAALGVAADVAAGGMTLGAATLLGGLGGLVGGVAGWLSAGKLAQVKVLDMPAGRKELRYGPSKNPNLPYVALGRARLHHRLVSGRTHAERGALVVGDAAPALSDAERKALQAQFARLRRRSERADVAEAVRDELADAVEDLLERDERGPG